MKNKIAQFMQGRYGNDTLNTHLLYVSVTFAVVSIIFSFPYINFVAILLIGVIYFRMFSKKRFKRDAENRKYLIAIAPLRKKMNRIKQIPKYKYLKCPECKSEMRVPRKKGKIVVTCPSCHAKFEAKS